MNNEIFIKLYVVVSSSQVATAVYANFLDDKGAPKKISEEVCDWLAKGGIRKLIVGHQPHGDCPMIIQCDKEITVCGGDTSYAAGVKYVKNEALGDLDLGIPVKDRKQGAIEKPNTRGVANSDILFYFTPDEDSRKIPSRMRVKGCLNTHQKYDFNFDEKMIFLSELAAQALSLHPRLPLQLTTHPKKRMDIAL